ncbi:MAG: hypothetical protein KatS3mg077_1663 [Candidatus Binatia bacterium]|nr:MAG: hypothetical protein KatS3mg077_1663 [Candidatus Binatia bacterium]
MEYVLEQTVSHARVDFLGEQKISDLLGMLEQAAVEASQACGWDPRAYAQVSGVWIIRRTRVCRWQPVGGLDRLRIVTQVADIRRARSLREYTVWRGMRLIAEAVTDWVYCDVHRSRPARVPAELARALHGKDTPPSFERVELPWPELHGAPVRFRSRVAPSHLDHLQHVNNASYADLFDDAVLDACGTHGWPCSRMLAAGGCLRPVALDLEYLDAASGGDEIEIETWSQWTARGDEPPQSAEFWQLARRTSDASIVARAVSSYLWRRRAPVLGLPPETASGTA